MGGNVKWNFTKLFVDKNGNVIDCFAPTVTPDKIKSKIQECM